MLIRWFWRDCDFSDKQWGAKPMDAFWVETTQEEAETSVFPHLQPTTISQSRGLAESSTYMAREMGNPSHLFCFLVARDLSSIDPFEAHYPIHQLWNAYSPFESMPQQIVVASLEELQKLDLPSRRPE